MTSAWSDNEHAMIGVPLSRLKCSLSRVEMNKDKRDRLVQGKLEHELARNGTESQA